MRMIEEIVLKYLRKKLDVPVYLDAPEQLPERFVRIEKTGSSDEDGIYSATFAIQSYGTDLSDTATLNEEVKKVMNEMVSLNEVMGADLNSDYNFTDTVRKRHRYQAVFDVNY